MRLSFSQSTSKKKSYTLPGWLRYTLIGASIIVVWQLYVTLSGVSPLLVASPIATAQALVTDVQNGQLPSAMLVSLQNLSIGMGIGIVVGLLLASFSTFSRFGRYLLTVLTAVFSPIPGIAILPLTMLWFGLSSSAIIFVVVFGSIWPISANTDTGFRTIGTTTRMVPPFLVGWDRGMDWRVLLASSRADSWLVSLNPKFKSLKDFGPNDKIGVVAPDAQQAIVLRKAAQEQLGNAHALDRNLIAIGSADGEQALLSGQLAAQLSGSPFQEREIAAGGHVILHTSDVFGPVGTGLIAVPQSFYNQYPTFTKKIYQDFVDVTSYVVSHYAEAAQYLANDKASGGGGSVTQFKTLLDNSGLVFEKTPSGLIAYAQFMKSIGLISKAPGSVNDLELPTVSGTGS